MPTRESIPRLNGGLIARKGEATPTGPSPVLEQPVLTPAVSNKVEDPAPAGGIPHGTAGTIAISVRLDPERYERMKIHGVRNRLTNQVILVEALDMYLNQKSL